VTSRRFADDHLARCVRQVNGVESEDGAGGLAPWSSASMWIVVSAGIVSAPYSVSSNPMTARSPGAVSPRSCGAVRTRSATSSPKAVTAVTARSTDRSRHELFRYRTPPDDHVIEEIIDDVFLPLVRP
jgi:hypothetical protein